MEQADGSVPCFPASLGILSYLSLAGFKPRARARIAEILHFSTATLAFILHMARCRVLVSRLICGILLQKYACRPCGHFRPERENYGRQVHWPSAACHGVCNSRRAALSGQHGILFFGSRARYVMREERTYRFLDKELVGLRPGCGHGPRPDFGLLAVTGAAAAGY